MGIPSINVMEKVLSNGYKVITSTEKKALGCDNLTKVVTNVFSPEGKLVISRNKGLFRNWSSECAMMNLPSELKGNYINKVTDIYTPNILPLPKQAIQQNNISVIDDVFRPTDGGGISFIRRTCFDKLGRSGGSALKFNEPIHSVINPEKHSKAQKLYKMVFG